MSLELRNGIYYIRAMVDGRRVQKSTKTSDRAVATAIHKKVMAEMVLGMHDMNKSKAPTLREAFDKAMRTHYARAKSAATVRTNYLTLERILGAATRLDTITRDTMDELVSTMITEGAKAGTINRKLALLSKLMRLNLESVPKIPLQKEYEGRKRYLTQTEEEALWKALDGLTRGNPTQPVWNSLRCLLTVLIDTGMRLGEALALEADSVDFQKRTVHVWVSKGDIPRTIPLTDRATAALSKMLPGMFTKALTKDIAEHRWTQLRKLAGLGDDVVLHSLRHTCATRLVQSGLQLAMVQRWMGHRDIKTTLIYSHVDTDDLHEGRDSLQKMYQNPTKVGGVSQQPE